MGSITTTPVKDAVLDPIRDEVADLLAKPIPGFPTIATVGEFLETLKGAGSVPSSIAVGLSDDDLLKFETTIDRTAQRIRRLDHDLDYGILQRRQKAVGSTAWDVNYRTGEESARAERLLPGKKAAVQRTLDLMAELRQKTETLIAVRDAVEERTGEVRKIRAESAAAPINKFVEEMTAAYLAGELGDSSGTIDPEAAGGPFLIVHQPGSEYITVGIYDETTGYWNNRVSVTLSRKSPWDDKPSEGSVNWSALGSVGVEEARQYAAMIRLSVLLVEVAANAGLVVDR